MKYNDLIKLARIKQKEADSLWKQVGRIEGKRAIYYQGKFTNQIKTKEGYTSWEVTPKGYKELAKNGVEYIEKRLSDNQPFWENPGISYTPESCFCMICGSTRTFGNLQLGIAPRFATCVKHGDFLYLYDHLKRIKSTIGVSSKKHE